MKYFKTVPDRKAERYEVNAENFAEQTKEMPPYEQKNEDGSFSQYAVCPSCLNPIQLIGISRKTKTRPYGRHTGKDVKGLGKWEQEKYEFCPYADPSVRRKPDDEETVEIDKDVRELYELLKSQFDFVADCVSDTLGIREGRSFWSAAVKQYLSDQAYCYPWLTEANLPYIFMYRGLQQKNLWGMNFTPGTPVYKALAEHPNVQFVPSCYDGYECLKQKDSFLNLHFRFTNHRQTAKGGKMLKESLKICVDEMDRNGMVKDTVYEKTLTFDEMTYQNFVRSHKDRKEWLLNIAEEEMKNL